MRCIICGNWSFSIICKECKEEFLKPNITKRKVGSLEVVSLFDYFQIADLVQTKYSPIGYRVYKFFAKEYIREFLVSYIKEANIDNLYLIAVDENIKRGYSNTSIMIHYASTREIKPLHGVLKAKNRVSYAGKSLEFRLKNPKDFSYSGKKNIDAILVDDLITTGTTLSQAYNEVIKHGVNVHFALTLANAKDEI